MSETHRAASRREFAANERPTVEDLKLGSLQRIADACELMAREHERLVRDAKWSREEVDRLRKRLETEERRVRAYRGVVARLKAQRKDGAK